MFVHSFIQFRLIGEDTHKNTPGDTDATADYTKMKLNKYIT